MADSDSEIEFNRRHNDTEMEEDQPGADIEELDQQQEHDIYTWEGSISAVIHRPYTWNRRRPYTTAKIKTYYGERVPRNTHWSTG